MRKYRALAVSVPVAALPVAGPRIVVAAVSAQRVSSICGTADRGRGEVSF
jgi:hypothetical protein